MPGKFLLQSDTCLTFTHTPQLRAALQRTNFAPALAAALDWYQGLLPDCDDER
jgi:hypothetical protein